MTESRYRTFIDRLKSNWCYADRLPCKVLGVRAGIKKSKPTAELGSKNKQKKREELAVGKDH